MIQSFTSLSSNVGGRSRERACAKLVEAWIKAKIPTKSYLLKLKVYFISVCLLVYVSVSAHDCRCPWRPEKDTGSSKIGFSSSCELPECWELNSNPLQKQ